MTSRPDSVPMPAALAVRPRDARGYPIPAITPWEDGQPLFASLSSIRTLICLIERRCSVCGLPMKRGPVWRVVHDDMTETIAQALETGLPWINLAPAHEGPGHRACMIYSAVVCPHLASPNARRTQDARASLTTLPKCLARGETAGVAGFKDYSYQMTALVGTGLIGRFSRCRRTARCRSRRDPSDAQGVRRLVSVFDHDGELIDVAHGHASGRTGCTNSTCGRRRCRRSSNETVAGGRRYCMALMRRSVSRCDGRQPRSLSGCGSSQHEELLIPRTFYCDLRRTLIWFRCGTTAGGGPSCTPKSTS
jgi:hypothetical protein